MASVSSLKDRARKEEQRGNWPRAADLYGQALRRAEEQGDLMRELGLYNRIGDLHLRMNDVDGAVLSFLQATDRYEEEGLQAPAVALCNKILRVSPEEDGVRLRLMRLHLSAGLVADARQVLVEYVRRADAADRDEEALLAILKFVAAVDDESLRLEAADRLADAGRRDEAARELARVRADRLERGESVADVDARLSRLAPDLVPEPAPPPQPEPVTPSEPEPEAETSEPAATGEPELAVAGEPEAVAGEEPEPAPEPRSRGRKRKATPSARGKGRSRPRKRFATGDPEMRGEPAAAAPAGKAAASGIAEPVPAEETAGESGQAEPGAAPASPESEGPEPRERQPRIPRYALDLPAVLPRVVPGVPVRTDITRFQVAIGDLAPAVDQSDGRSWPVATRELGTFAADARGFVPPWCEPELVAPSDGARWLASPAGPSWLAVLDARAELAVMGSWRAVEARSGPDGSELGSASPVGGETWTSLDRIRVAVGPGRVEPGVGAAEPDGTLLSFVRIVPESALPAVVSPTPPVADSGDAAEPFLGPAGVYGPALPALGEGAPLRSWLPEDGTSTGPGGAVELGGAVVEPGSWMTAIADVGVAAHSRPGSLSSTNLELEPDGRGSTPVEVKPVRPSAADGGPAPVGSGGLLEVGFRQRAAIPKAAEKESRAEPKGVLRFLKGLRHESADRDEESARASGEAIRSALGSRGEMRGLATVLPGFDATSVDATTWGSVERLELPDATDAEFLPVTGAAAGLAEAEDLRVVPAPWEREPETGDSAREPPADAQAEPEVMDAGEPEAAGPVAEAEELDVEAEGAEAPEAESEAQPDAVAADVRAEPDAAETEEEEEEEAPERPIPETEPSVRVSDASVSAPEEVSAEEVAPEQAAPETPPAEERVEESLSEVLRKRWAAADEEGAPNGRGMPAGGRVEPEAPPQDAPSQDAARTAERDDASSPSTAEEADTLSPAASFLSPSGERDEDFPDLTGMLENLGWLGGAEAEGESGEETTGDDDFVHPSPWKAKARPSSLPAGQRPGHREGESVVDEEVPNLTDMLRTMGWLSAGTEAEDPSTPSSGAEVSEREDDADSTRSER